ncbi:MAG: pentapeptide repeat-containing protein, partial [Rothia dentocariosa]|nr:pentapeptide repeat-containing protein [Rothia dentocariosa]
MTPSASTSNLTMLNRRARYIVALEQLGSSDPTVRMSGVYALVWLVDEWMNTDDAPAAQCRQEAQAAISSLCAYVRSPFSLASEYARFSSLEPAPFINEQEKQLFTVDKALFEAEAQVRAGIVEAIHSRTIVVDGKPGAWSGFQFDFTGSVFFYPVTFTGSCWGRPLSLRGCTYHASADFSRSVYYGDVDFSDSVFGGPTSFGYSVYRQAAKVHGCTFNGPVFFGVSHYHQGLDARTNLYNSDADFSGSVYRDDAYLHGCNYYGDANLSRCTYFG